MELRKLNMWKSAPFFFVILVICYLYFSGNFTEKRAKEEFLKFHESNIDGLVENSTIEHHSVKVTLTDGNKFYFHPYLNKELNQKKYFDLTAEKGDTIRKRKNGDTIFLIHEHKIYKYLFQKWEENSN
jgi:hypothetical protein